MTAPGSEQRKELEVLLASLVEAGLSVQKKARLRELLQDDAQARLFYKRYIEVHAMLQWESGTMAAEDTDADSDEVLQALAELARLHEEGLNQPIDIELHRKQRAQHAAAQQGQSRRFSTKVIAAGSLAAAIALAGLTVLVVNMLSSPEQPIVEQLDEAIVVATLTDAHHAVWQTQTGESIDLPINSPMTKGLHLTLTEGFAEITTDRGAIAVLEAPATIELLDNNNAIHLHTGKFVGLCHTESSKGFVVKTDFGDITDLGTEFAVEAKPEGVDTTVFVGKVTLTTLDGATMPITTNQTARLYLENGKRMIALEDKPAKGFTRRLPRPAMVTDADINLGGFHAEIVPNGIYEDAKLFTDRDHELNGIDAAGLPAFLIGGDLVRMPADARPDVTPEVGDVLRLTISLSQPADIYLLLSDESEAPAWLQRDYEQTSLKVGIDLAGRTSTNLRTYDKAGIGPGISIDRSAGVWKRKLPATGRVIVGQNVQESMYTVVVVPRGDDNRLD